MCFGCYQSVPTIGVVSVALTDTAAVLNLSGAIPVSGRFNVRVCGRCLDVCSALPIELKDNAGTAITTVYDKCGNPVLLNKVAVQARRHALLHFCRSVVDDIVILQDSICTPTPVLDESSAVKVSIVNGTPPASTKPSTETDDSSCESGKCPSGDIVPPGQYK